MKVVRDHPEARWLPSRHRFAAFRLLAQAMFRPAPASQPGLVLGIDRDQSALEQNTIAAWTGLTVTCFAYAFLERVAIWPVAAVLAPFVAFLTMTFFVVWPFFGPATLRERDTAAFNSFVAMFAIAVAALYLAGTGSWVRWVAWFFLACLGVNGAAAVLIAVGRKSREVILAGAVLAPLLAVALWWWWSPYAAVGALMVSHALVLYPTLRANSQWLGPVATRFETNQREVWLTIDDGPTGDTPALLDALDERGARATFFVKGTLAAKHPEFIRAIVERGHEVANHSHTHPSASFWCLPPGGIRREIDECNRVLREHTGSPSRFFRAPVGMKNPFVHPALGGMQLVGWSARAFDTTTDDAEAVLRRLLPDVSPGAILLLHQGRAKSVEIIGRVVDALQKDGYAFVLPDAGRLKTNR